LKCGAFCIPRRAVLTHHQRAFVLKAFGVSGENSIEIPICLPLPTMPLWVALHLQAHRLNLSKVARPAISVLQQHFIESTSDRSMWEAHPMDCLTLNEDNAAAASPTLQRGFAVSTFAHTGTLLAALDHSQHCADNELLLSAHVERLKLVKQQLIGIHVRSAPHPGSSFVLPASHHK
jgi:hypothetical protein